MFECFGLSPKLLNQYQKVFHHHCCWIVLVLAIWEGMKNTTWKLTSMKVGVYIWWTADQNAAMHFVLYTLQYNYLNA